MVFSIFNKIKKPKELPWIVEGKKVFGLHEINDNKVLKEWLVSDRRTLGDSKALPWCGDYVETAIKKSLPKETFHVKLNENPYWARNWLLFGVDCNPPTYGAIIVFSRGNGGHVGFVVGEDNTDYYVLGGNQSNAVTITRISKSRYLGSRWPSTFKNPNIPLPKMSSTNIPRTTNEF